MEPISPSLLPQERVSDTILLLQSSLSRAMPPVGARRLRHRLDVAEESAALGIQGEAESTGDELGALGWVGGGGERHL